MNYRAWWFFVLSARLLGQAPAGPAQPDTTQWFDVTRWGVEGRAWAEQPRVRWFDRLPAAAEKTVTPAVWNLSRESAGMVAHFKTDARALRVRYRLLNAKLAYPHMPATGVSGLDLYARDEAGRWRWVQVTRPEAQEATVDLVKGGLAPGPREYALYLPLGNGVESLEIGVPAGSAFEGVAPRSRPVVFYGTSITHGMSASRPGMVHPAILGRRLDVPVLNLGFSGNGKMDAAIGDLMTEIEARVYVIDCEPNMSAELVTQRCAPLVRQLRARRPDTPIVLVEERRVTNEWILPDARQAHDVKHAALRAAYEILRGEGVTGLAYIAGDHLYGDDSEGATDGSHASDLGFMRQADVMEPVVRAALGR